MRERRFFVMVMAKDVSETTKWKRVTWLEVVEANILLFMEAERGGLDDSHRTLR